MNTSEGTALQQLDRMDNTTPVFAQMLSLQQKGKPIPRIRFRVLTVSTTNCLFLLTVSGNHPF